MTDLDSLVDRLCSMLGSAWAVSDNDSFFGAAIWKGPHMYCHAESKADLVKAFVEKTKMLRIHPDSATAGYFTVPCIFAGCDSVEELAVKIEAS